MTLSPELRNRIYGLVLLSPTAIRLHKDKPPGLLGVSKQIRHEAWKMYYAGNTFHLIEGSSAAGFTDGVRTIRTVVAACGPKPFRQFNVIHSNYCLCLHSLLPLLELMHESGFEPATATYTGPDPYTDAKGFALYRNSATSVFRIFDNDNDLTPAEEVLEEALNIARKARQAGWTRQELAQEFWDFLKTPKHWSIMSQLRLNQRANRARALARLGAARH